MFLLRGVGPAMLERFTSFQHHLTAQSHTFIFGCHGHIQAFQWVINHP